MKKALSIIMSVLLTVTMLLGVSASAMTAKSEALLKNIVDTKSVTINVDDYNFEDLGISITDVSLSLKFTKNASETYDFDIGGRAKIGPFNAKVVGNNKELYAYFLFFKVNITSLLGDIDLAELTKEITPLLDEINADKLDYLKFEKSYTDTSTIYGNVTVEQYVPNIQAIAEDYAEDLDVDLGGMSDEQIIQTILDCDEEAAEFYAKVVTLKVEFIYSNDNLVDMRVLAYNEGTGDYDLMFTLSSELGLKLKSIVSPADESAFEESSFAFDLTFLFKMLIGSIA